MGVCGAGWLRGCGWVDMRAYVCACIRAYVRPCVHACVQACDEAQRYPPPASGMCFLVAASGGAFATCCNPGEAQGQCVHAQPAGKSQLPRKKLVTEPPCFQKMQKCSDFSSEVSVSRAPI